MGILWKNIQGNGCCNGLRFTGELVSVEFESWGIGGNQVTPEILQAVIAGEP